MNKLELYLAAARRTPFIYGTMDCWLFVAGAIKAQTGRDLAASYRGRYATLDEGVALLPRWRGLPRTMADILRDAGFARTATPRNGDVGCVRVLVDDHHQHAGAVRFRGAWWLKSTSGLARLDDTQARTVAAWRIT